MIYDSGKRLPPFEMIFTRCMLGCRVYDSGQGLSSQDGVYALDIRVQGPGSRVQVPTFRDGACVPLFRVQGSGFSVQVPTFRDGAYVPPV